MKTMPRNGLFHLVLASATLVASLPAFAQVDREAADRGLQNFKTKVYAVAAPFLTLSESIFEKLPMVWPKELQDAYQSADAKGRRQLLLDRYGFHEAPFDNGGLPLGFAKSKTQVNGQDRMEGTCLLCHAGNVGPTVMIGRANSNLDLPTFFEDLVGYRLGTGDFSDLNDIEKAVFQASLPALAATANTNASRAAVDVWASGHMTLSLRDKDMNPLPAPAAIPLPALTVLDAPAWWNTQFKSRLYSDGFMPKNARTPLLAGLSALSSGEEIRSFEKDFEDNLEYWKTIEPPKYPGAINQRLAARGRKVFEVNCAKCHGKYGDDGEVLSYPDKIVSAEKVGTDPLRVEKGLSAEYRLALKEGWIGYYGKADVSMESKGYYAPPLKGVWASAPYFHNGSVPTLYHVLHPEARPTVWKNRDLHGYDVERVGLWVDELKQVPAGLSPQGKRQYYDTTAPGSGKGNAGHLFVNVLSEPEKRQVLEYLKTL